MAPTDRPLHHPRPGIYNAVSRSDLWAPACARHRAPPRYTKCACGRTAGPSQITDHNTRHGIHPSPLSVFFLSLLGGSGAHWRSQKKHQRGRARRSRGCTTVHAESTLSSAQVLNGSRNHRGLHSKCSKTKCTVTSHGVPSSHLVSYKPDPL